MSFICVVTLHERPSALPVSRQLTPTLEGLLVVTATGERPDDLSDAIGHGGGARSDDSPGHHVEP